MKIPTLGRYGYGEQMRAARKARGMTQTALGKALGVTAQYVCDLEYERRQPSERVALALSRVLDVQWYRSDALYRQRIEALETALRRLATVTGELSYNQVGDALWTEFVTAHTEALSVLTAA